ncbi:MAG: Heparinase family protein [Actinomycetia bacterium]|nr:Heparinase family protein [Actinomycetes bacterium]
MRLGWYARRLARMSPAEVAWRVREQAIRRAWSGRQVRQDQVGKLPPLPSPVARQFTSRLPPGAAGLVPQDARDALLADASRLLGGEWEMLGVVRTDMKDPDWFHDPATGRRSAPGTYAFRLDSRSEEQVGNIKQVWEVSRLQHLTLLAAAWHLTGDDAYAERVDAQLRSWLAANPFLSGVNWTSGIELGIRLINFAWIRRLLDGWAGAESLFEGNDLFVWQVRWHQQYLAAFESRGSSANNHLIAEAAGQLAASCAFPWFGESAGWRVRSAAVLEESLRANTFISGINRELATDYHGFVFELGVLAVLEAAAAGTPVSDSTWALLCAMADAMAAVVDVRLRPPRQGDSDEGRVVLLDAPEHNRWPALLTLGGAVFGCLDWWPEVAPNAGSVLAGAIAGKARPVAAPRPAERPSRFADAGLTILRTNPAGAPEIWCRCDGGPHGFLSIAAHAHADALSVEVRCDGVDILADPGTYCYHGEPEWRKYFQSTIGHNTVEVGGQWQSVRGGAFLWLRHAAGQEISVNVRDDGDIATWTASHDGYRLLSPAATHQRTVHLDRTERVVEVTDRVDGGHYGIRMAFHLGFSVEAVLDGPVAELTWPGGTARLSLPAELRWTLHRGETDPILGWYSAGLGHRVPATTLLGEGQTTPGTVLISSLRFTEAGLADPSPQWQAVSLGKSGSTSAVVPGTQAEAR